MKRKILITLLIAVLTTMMSLSALATNELITSAKPGLLISPGPKSNVEVEDELTSNVINVQLDGEYINFTDEQGNTVNPEIINNRTMVPMRRIFEIFGANIDWNNETRTVVATTGEKEITLTINNDKATVKNLLTNEEEEIILDAAPLILNNRTMVPVRFIAESLEKEVGWDADERTVIIIDFDKIVATIEEKIPVLKKLFEIEIETVKSVKTKSEITGNITYKDKKEKANNETVKFEGVLDVNVNEALEIEMFLDLEFSGKGTIYNSLVEAGYKEISLGIVMADGNTYMMLGQAGKEVWTNLGPATDMSQIVALQGMTQPKNVEELVALLKSFMGELDSTSYLFLQGMIELMANIYNEESLEIIDNGSRQTVKYSINLKELLTNLVSGADLGIDGLDMNIEMREKILNKKVDSANLKLDIFMEEPTTEESFSLELDMDMKYTNLNKDFDIKLPEVEIEEY